MFQDRAKVICFIGEVDKAAIHLFLGAFDPKPEGLCLARYFVFVRMAHPLLVTKPDWAEYHTF